MHVSLIQILDQKTEQPRVPPSHFLRFEPDLPLLLVEAHFCPQERADDLWEIIGVELPEFDVFRGFVCAFVLPEHFDEVLSA